MTRWHSQSERPSHLIGWNRRRTPRFEVIKPFLRNAAILKVNKRFITLDQFRRHDCCGAALPSAPGYVGDLAAEGGTIHGIREVVAGLADGQLRLFGTHIAIVRQLRQDRQS